MLFLNSRIPELLTELRLATQADVDNALIRFASLNCQRSTNWPRQERSPHRERVALKMDKDDKNAPLEQTSIADFMVHENVCSREQAEFAKLVQAVLSLLGVYVQTKLRDQAIVTTVFEIFDKLQNSEGQHEPIEKTQPEKVSATIRKGLRNLNIALMPILGPNFLYAIYCKQPVRIAF
jgi:hypothetical protein